MCQVLENKEELMYEIVVLETVNGDPEILKGENGRPILFPRQLGPQYVSKAGLAGSAAVASKPLDYVSFEIWHWEKSQ